ncbi:MAG: hypothetical protein RIT14_2184, partial [Pseudomonadota bacterium]
MLWETIRLAARAIIRNKLRSFLTVLGVVIGVAAVIAMVTVGQGSSAKVAADVESLGSNILILRPGAQSMGPGPREDAAPFSLRDAEAVAALAAVAAAAPVTNTGQTVVFGSANASTTVTGTTAAYLEVSNWPLRQGRAFTEGEDRAGS